MFKKALVLTLFAFCLLAATSALAQTVHLQDIGMSVDVPEGCAAFYDGHVDEAQAQKYMGMDQKKMTNYLKEYGYQLVICQRNPSCEIMIESRPAEDSADWNDMDFEKFLDNTATGAQRARSQMNVTKMKALITNQTRYVFTHFSVDTSSQNTYDMYQYQTQVSGNSVAITCLAYDDTIDDEKAFFDQVVDSIWYDGVDSIYGPAPAASGKSGGEVVETDAFSARIPDAWSKISSGNIKYTNGYLHLIIACSDGWAKLSAQAKQGRDRSSFTFDGIVAQNISDSFKDWVKQIASDFETKLSSLSMTVEDVLDAQAVKTFGIPDSMLPLALDNNVSYDDGALIMAGGKPFILFTGKSTMTGEDERVMVRYSQDVRLYYNLNNGYINTLQFTGEIQEDTALEIEKVLDTLQFE